MIGYQIYKVDGTLKSSLDVVCGLCGGKTVSINYTDTCLCTTCYNKLFEAQNDRN